MKHKAYSYVSIFMLLAMGTSLSACAKAGESVQRIGTDMHTEGQKMDRKVRSWFDEEGIGAADASVRPQPDTAYCYKTLGERSCYSHPIEGEDERIVGRQLPPPPAYAKGDTYYYHNAEPFVPGEVSVIEAPAPVVITPLPVAPKPKTIPQTLSPQVF